MVMSAYGVGAILIPSPWMKTLRHTGGDVPLAFGRGWKGSSTAGSSPMAGPRSTWPKQSGEARKLGPVHPLLGRCGIAWSEPQHRGTESSSGKLPSSSLLLAWLRQFGSGGPRSLGGGSV